MSTTTIRIDDDLKERVATAARLAGKTAHAFMLEAIEQTVEQAEIDAQFDRLADERWVEVLAAGRTVAWDDAKAYLEARLRGDKARRPAAHRPRR